MVFSVFITHGVNNGVKVADICRFESSSMDSKKGAIYYP
jgi:hypothetical protein